MPRWQSILQNVWRVARRVLAWAAVIFSVIGVVICIAGAIGCLVARAPLQDAVANGIARLDQARSARAKLRLYARATVWQVTQLGPALVAINRLLAKDPRLAAHWNDRTDGRTARVRKIVTKLQQERLLRSGLDEAEAVTAILALSLPEATERAHMRHPDFRVRNKIFASLGAPNADWGMVKLTPEQQEMLMAAEPGAFVPAAGAWGRRGYTTVRLAAADATALRSALTMAWRNTAPKALVAKPKR